MFLPPFLIYAARAYVGVLVFGAIVSFPRFVAVLFPLWLPLTAKLSFSKKALAVTVIVAAAFFLVGLDMWMSFLNGQFVE